MLFCNFFSLTLSLLTQLTPIPTGKIDSTVEMNQLAASASTKLHSLSMFDMFLQANIVVQFVMTILIFASIWSWAITFNKLIVFKTIKNQMKLFIRFFESGKSIDEVLTRIHRSGDTNPLAQILVTTFDEWDSKNDRLGKFSDANSRSKSMNDSVNITKECLHQSMQLASNRALENLEDGIDILATIGSSSPFIGLFGTVWGIMSSFQAIATAQNTSLAVVAPGIAEALLATAFGLVAAIPSVIFYNKFSREIEKIAGKSEDFQLELSTIILKEILN